MNIDKVPIENLLKDSEDRHSDFQIENFIIKNKGNIWAQYKQCLREMNVRYNSILKHEAKIDQLKYCNSNLMLRLKTIFSKKRKKLETKLIIDIQSNQKKVDDIRAEFNCILKIAKKLKKQIGEVTDERRQQLELESWTAKGRKMAAIDHVLTGRISHQTFEFILALPVESQNSILDKVLSDDTERRLLIESLNDEGK